MTSVVSFLAIALLVGVVFYFVPILFTGTAPATPEGDLSIGSNTLLRGIPAEDITCFWPLSFSVWLAFSPRVRLVVAGIIFLSILGSNCLTASTKRLFLWSLVAALAITIVINMIGIFHVF